MAVLKKQFWGVPVLKFLQRLALDFPYICHFFSVESSEVNL